jgi:hypothetical protein
VNPVISICLYNVARYLQKIMWLWRRRNENTCGLQSMILFAGQTKLVHWSFSADILNSYVDCNLWFLLNVLNFVFDLAIKVFNEV